MKRLFAAAHESGSGTKRILIPRALMSVAGGKAEISQPRHYDDLYVSNGPKMTDPDPNPFAERAQRDYRMAAARQQRRLACSWQSAYKYLS